MLDKKQFWRLINIMDIKLIKIEEDIIIGGLSVETTPEHNDKVLEKLYNDFIHNGRMKYLNSLTNNMYEYYGVIWYTKIHEKYKYLLGQRLTEKIENLDMKILKKGQYACSKFPQKYDGIKAWTDFYSKEIPEIGYKPIEQEDIAFEYYPSGLDGEYELWSLVKKV
jgi:hypothetical protein